MCVEPNPALSGLIWNASAIDIARQLIREGRVEQGVILLDQAVIQAKKLIKQASYPAVSKNTAA